MLFADRADAGRVLIERLGAYADRPDVTVLALPRGGVVVAYEVAHALRAPLDVLVVRKLGVPGHSELAMGAIASGGARVLSPDVIGMLGITQSQIEAVAVREQSELERRERAYRGTRVAAPIYGRIVLLVDDGLATGATMRAAVRSVREHEPRRVVVAVPVGAPETCAELRTEADEVVCARSPEPFCAVGAWYDEFSQTGDDEVRELLARAARELGGAASSSHAEGGMR